MFQLFFTKHYIYNEKYDCSLNMEVTFYTREPIKKVSLQNVMLFRALSKLSEKCFYEIKKTFQFCALRLSADF